ncbi:MAG: hypothetical protein K2Z81_19905, partial [Cyanobacteria bacterium]|nr:hypothetical protein [Cyanobacteriota bacterium]
LECNPSLTDAGLEYLKDLKLEKLTVHDTGVKTLAALSTQQELRKLNLRRTAIGDSALKNLSSLRKLEDLDLSGTRITKKGLRSLAKIKSLTEVALDKCPNLEENDVVQLGYEIPLCNLPPYRLRAYTECQVLSDKELTAGRKLQSFNELKRVCDVLERDRGHKSAYLPILYLKMGAVAKDMGNREKALQSYSKIVNGQFEAIDTSVLSTALEGSTALYIDANQLKLAALTWKRWLELEKKSKGASEGKFADIYRSGGGIYATMRQYDEAICLYNKSLTISKQLANSSSKEVRYTNMLAAAATYMLLADVYMNRKEFGKCAQACKQGLVLREQCVGGDSLQSIWSRTAMAHALWYAKRIPEAESEIRRACVAADKLYKLDPVVHADLCIFAHQVSALVAENEKNWKRALSDGERVCQIAHSIPKHKKTVDYYKQRTAHFKRIIELEKQQRLTSP